MMTYDLDFPHQETLRAVARVCDEETFCAQYPDPVLWVLPMTGSRASLAEAESITERFHGQEYRATLLQDDVERADPDVLAAYDQRVLALRKREGNPFPDMITIGRAGTSDLPLAIGSVSKLHAYFLREEGDWYVSDCGSTNGTFVDGVRLERRVPQAVAPGTTVTLGKDVVTHFLTPRALYSRLRAD